MSKTILCIEDDPSTCQLVKRVFEARGFHVLLARNGEEGIKLAEAQLPDVILLDINLPDMNGYTVARRIREGQPGLAQTPMVALTGNALDGDAEKALQAGCNLYLAKPVSIRELWNRVEMLLPTAA